MTFPAEFVPLFIAIVLAVAVTTVHRRLPPVLAARAVLITMVVVLGAALPTLWIASLGYLADAPVIGSRFRWCAEALGGHHPIPAAVGIVATMASVAGILRLLRVVRVHRRLRRDETGSVEIATDDQPFAFTLPGRGGHVIVSTGLIDMLDAPERDVVFAHEQAHARHRHDRYLLTAKLASSALPFLRPLASRLKFSLERWADEVAAESCGDRRLVAQTLAKVAMKQLPAAGMLGFNGLGVPGRVAALLAPPVSSPARVSLAGLWVAIGATGALAAFQIHHLFLLLTALCPG